MPAPFETTFGLLRNAGFCLLPFYFCLLTFDFLPLTFALPSRSGNSVPSENSAHRRSLSGRLRKIYRSHATEADRESLNTIIFSKQEVRLDSSKQKRAQ